MAEWIHHHSSSSSPSAPSPTGDISSSWLQLDGFELLEELKLCIREIVESGQKGQVILDDTPEVSRLCFLLEIIFLHGFKEKVSLFGNRVFWDFIEKLEECLPNAPILDKVRDITKNSLARGRVFIRIALNEGSLSEYLSSLFWNASLLQNYYKDWALFQDEEQVSILFMLLETLKSLQFRLWYNDKQLEKQNYWNPNLFIKKSDIPKDVRDKTEKIEKPPPEESHEDILNQHNEQALVNSGTGNNTKKGRRRKKLNKKVVDIEDMQVVKEENSDDFDNPPHLDGDLPENQDISLSTETMPEHAESSDHLFTEILEKDEKEILEKVDEDVSIKNELNQILEEKYTSEPNFQNQINSSDSRSLDQNLHKTEEEQSSFTLKRSGSIFQDEIIYPTKHSSDINDEKAKTTFSWFSEDDFSEEQDDEKYLTIPKLLKNGSRSLQVSHYQILDDYLASNAKEIESETEDEEFVFATSPREKTSRCHQCQRSVSQGVFSRLYMCHYTGFHYCKFCFGNEKSVIPARVVFNWDRREFSVCINSKKEILGKYSLPIIQIDKLNFELYKSDPNLKTLQNLRAQLYFIGDYLQTCTKHRERLLSLLDKKYYLIEKSHTYSLKDLVELKSFLKFIKDLVSVYTKHITQDCESCRGKGFFCELCNKPPPIFRFQIEEVTKCARCRTLFHRTCCQSIIFDCPKCKRIDQLKS